VKKVASADGAQIAFERFGEGRPLILVGGALCDRAATRPLAEELAHHFAVINYDRRGRGDSGDSSPYAVEREIEDLGALIAEVGGTALLYGHSSGACLALQAAARGLPVTRLVLHEPPYGPDDEDDFQVMGNAGRGGTIPEDLVAAVGIPALVLSGGASPAWMNDMGRQIAAALPNGRHLVLESQERVVAPEVLAPLLVEFFDSSHRMTIDDVLAAARSQLRRLYPADASTAAGNGARLVDTRPQFQRHADGEIPGALIVERNHLEWRLDPTSAGRIPEATDHDIAWIVLCEEGYSSSLAAASLQLLGLRNATDVIGGFQAWKTAGLPVITPTTPTRPRLAEE
jgi:pimeloyl-ACP methyl ester carboxylesterase